MTTPGTRRPRAPGSEPMTGTAPDPTPTSTATMEDESDTRSRGSQQDQGWSGAIRQLAESSLNSQKHRARESLDELARTIRESAEPLTSNGRTTAAGYVRTTADRLEAFASALDERSFNDLVADVQNFARRQPALFIGAALGAGVLGARFFKSSAEHSAPPSGGQRTQAPGARFQSAPPVYGDEIPSGSTA